MSKDYYKILGISKDATKEEIKRAFREKAVKYHPDKQGGDPEKFKEINEAYQVLHDDEKRKRYDQFGTTFDQAGSSGGFNWSDFARGGAGGYGFDINDIFNDFFGMGFGSGRSTQRRPTKGEDISVILELEFKQALFGDKTDINIKKTVKCDKCSGNGAERGSRIITCKRCNGTGKVKNLQRTIFGQFQTVTTCPECRGEGKYPEKKCSQCNGAGIIKKMQTISVEIPAGIDDGDTIKIAGKGEAGFLGGPYGDLYVTFKVKKDYKFKRQGYDIYSKINIPFSVAALGNKVKVETIEGDVILKVPPGTQNNHVFKLKGKGVKKLKASGKGDHYVEIKVAIPKKMTREQKKILEQYAQIEKTTKEGRDLWANIL